MSERRSRSSDPDDDEDSGPGPAEITPPTPPEKQPAAQQPDQPGDIDAPGVDVAPGQILEFERHPGESDAEYMARTRHVVPESQSPTDVVPNRPNISVGQPVPVEGQEGLRHASPPQGQGMPPGGAEGPTSVAGQDEGTEATRAHEPGQAHPPGQSHPPTGER